MRARPRPVNRPPGLVLPDDPRLVRAIAALFGDGVTPAGLVAGILADAHTPATRL